MTLFDDDVLVHYDFILINPSDEDNPDLDDSRAGRTNGLLGGAVPGQLSVVTGTHTGGVRLPIEWHERQPAIDPARQDILEVSLELTDSDLTLSAFDDFHELTAPVTGSHRVRLNAVGMDAARDQDSPDEGESAADRYLLPLWKAPAEPDRIVRQTSQCAEYWQGVAQETPPVRAERIAGGRQLRALVARLEVAAEQLVASCRRGSEGVEKAGSSRAVRRRHARSTTVPGPASEERPDRWAVDRRTRSVNICHNES